MAVGQNQWYHFGVGAPPIIVYFSGDWDVHCKYGVLTRGHLFCGITCLFGESVSVLPGGLRGGPGAKSSGLGVCKQLQPIQPNPEV